MDENILFIPSRTLFYSKKTYKNKILMWGRGGGGEWCILNEASRLNQEIVD